MTQLSLEITSHDENAARKAEETQTMALSSRFRALFFFNSFLNPLHEIEVNAG